jgi:hypothetical protein
MSTPVRRIGAQAFGVLMASPNGDTLPFDALFTLNFHEAPD